MSKSIAAMKGETAMSDQEKFEGFKKDLVSLNEEKYGAEIRQKYGDTALGESNAHLMGLTQQQYDEGERLRIAIGNALKTAIASGDPASEAAQNACDLHRRWLSVFYPNYRKDYHRGLAEMYVADELFKAYYEKIAPRCAEFLRDAINVYCAE